MPAYAALDVSMKMTSIHVVNEAGACLWRGKVSLPIPNSLLKHPQLIRPSLLASVSKQAAGQCGIRVTWEKRDVEDSCR